jgi:hypothetical protein
VALQRETTGGGCDLAFTLKEMPCLPRLICMVCAKGIMHITQISGGYAFNFKEGTDLEFMLQSSSKCHVQITIKSGITGTSAPLIQGKRL